MDFSELRQAVVDGDSARARALAESVVSSGVDLLDAVERGFSAGIRRVGELWEEGEYFLPELMQGAEAMAAAMAVMEPALRAAGGHPTFRGRVVIGTVEGDLHDIGKTLVATMLSASGFEVHDLGTDVSIETFVRRAREVDADIVGASALLTTTMGAQRRLVTALQEAGMARTPHVMVGGAPVSFAWANEIGAHHAENALGAVAVAERLLS
jgi:trimethylamine corrinoid protein